MEHMFTKVTSYKCKDFCKVHNVCCYYTDNGSNITSLLFIHNLEHGTCTDD